MSADYLNWRKRIDKIHKQFYKFFEWHSGCRDWPSTGCYFCPRNDALECKYSNGKCDERIWLNGRNLEDTIGLIFNDDYVRRFTISDRDYFNSIDENTPKLPQHYQHQTYDFLGRVVDDRPKARIDIEFLDSSPSFRLKLREYDSIQLIVDGLEIYRKMSSKQLINALVSLKNTGHLPNVFKTVQ